MILCKNISNFGTMHNKKCVLLNCRLDGNPFCDTSDNNNYVAKCFCQQVCEGMFQTSKFRLT
jgi:hypothetical protein